MEVRLKSSPPGSLWQCQVSLRHEYDDIRAEVIEQYEELFGTPILDSSKVEGAIRRAQLAILNPSVKATDFVEFDLNLREEGKPPLGSAKQYSVSRWLLRSDN